MAKLDPTTYLLKSGKKVIFRQLVPGDAERFLHIRSQVPQEFTIAMQYVGMKLPNIEETAKRFETQLADKAILNIGVFDSEEVIGYLNFRMPNPDHPWVQYLGQFGMMILKKYWGQGIGKKLLDLQEQHASSVGITRIEAMVRVKNDRGIKLYVNNGYKIEGTRRNAARIDGEYCDEYFIAKILNDLIEDKELNTRIHKTV